MSGGPHKESGNICWPHSILFPSHERCGRVASEDVEGYQHYIEPLLRYNQLVLQFPLEHSHTQLRGESRFESSLEEALQPYLPDRWSVGFQ